MWLWRQLTDHQNVTTPLSPPGEDIIGRQGRRFNDVPNVAALNYQACIKGFLLIGLCLLPGWGVNAACVALLLQYRHYQSYATYGNSDKTKVILYSSYRFTLDKNFEFWQYSANESTYGDVIISVRFYSWFAVNERKVSFLFKLCPIHLICWIIWHCNSLSFKLTSV